MSEGDRQTTIGNGLPRLGEISRAVTRGIRSLADAAYPDAAPSFAASLASASAAVAGDDPSAGATPAEGDVMRGGRKPGDPPQPGTSLMARPGRDRAAGAVASLTHVSPPRVPSPPAPHPAAGEGSRLPTPPPAVAAAMPVAVAAGMPPAVAAATSPPLPLGDGRGEGATSFPQHGASAPVTGPVVASQGTAYAAIPGAATSATSDQSVAAASSGASPSLSAAARSTSSLPASTPAGSNAVTAPGLALEQYPKPARSDRSGVLTWASAAPPTGRDLDRLVAEAKHRRVGWVTFVADPERLDQYGDLADRLTKAGIQPIARVQDPEGNLPAGDVSDLVKELRSHGVRYFQLFDDANVAEQTPDYRVDVPDYAQRWLAAARAVVAGGGLPGIGALAPDGDYDDLGFMRQLLSEVKQRGGTDVFGQSWLALRGETPGAASTKTDVGDLASRAEWFDRVSRQALGRSLPILATLDPASSTTGAPAPSSSAPPDPSVVAETAERALRGLRRKLPALFAASRGTLEAARA